MFCEKCNTILEDGALFCYKCGQSTIKASPVVREGFEAQAQSNNMANKQPKMGCLFSSITMTILTVFCFPISFILSVIRLVKASKIKKYVKSSIAFLVINSIFVGLSMLVVAMVIIGSISLAHDAEELDKVQAFILDGDYIQAQAILEKERVSRPTSEEVAMLYAQLYETQGKDNKAADVLTQYYTDMQDEEILRLSEDIQTKAIDLQKKSTGDSAETLECQIQRIALVKQQETERIAKEEQEKQLAKDTDKARQTSEATAKQPMQEEQEKAKQSSEVTVKQQGDNKKTEKQRKALKKNIDKQVKGLSKAMKKGDFSKFVKFYKTTSMDDVVKQYFYVKTDKVLFSSLSKNLKVYNEESVFSDEFSDKLKAIYKLANDIGLAKDSNTLDLLIPYINSQKFANAADDLYLPKLSFSLNKEIPKIYEIYVTSMVQNNEHIEMFGRDITSKYLNTAVFTFNSVSTFFNGEYDGLLEFSENDGVKQGHQSVYAIQSGTENVKDIDGFEHTLPVYKKISKTEMQTYYEHSEDYARQDTLHQMSVFSKNLFWRNLKHPQKLLTAENVYTVTQVMALTDSLCLSNYPSEIPTLYEQSSMPVFTIHYKDYSLDYDGIETAIYDLLSKNDKFAGNYLMDTLKIIQIDGNINNCMNYCAQVSIAVKDEKRMRQGKIELFYDKKTCAFYISKLDIW